jgi:hypothetical protein
MQHNTAQHSTAQGPIELVQHRLRNSERTVAKQCICKTAPHFGSCAVWRWWLLMHGTVGRAERLAPTLEAGTLRALCADTWLLGGSSIACGSLSSAGPTYCSSSNGPCRAHSKGTGAQCGSMLGSQAPWKTGPQAHPCPPPPRGAAHTTRVHRNDSLALLARLLLLFPLPPKCFVLLWVALWLRLLLCCVD